MKTVYTLQLYEEEIRSDGFYEVETAEEIFRLIKNFTKAANHDVHISLRKHEIDHACDVCGAGSIKEELRLGFEKSRERI